MTDEKLQDMLNFVISQRDNAMNVIVSLQADLAALRREMEALKKKPGKNDKETVN